MAATTFSAIRSTVLTQVHAIAPVSHSADLFRSHKEELDFREWAESKPKACFRRFTFVDLFDYQEVLISNSDQELQDGMAELLVGYPANRRYGPDANRDMRDVVIEDFHSIDNVVGHRQTANTNAAIMRVGNFDLEELDGAYVMSVRYRVVFYRSV